MKKIVCEMCGSNELIKKDGVFECQTCGTKYSVEEAKKMMVEGTVDIEGTVKIDDSNKIDNLIKNAKTLYNDGKNDEAYKLFGDVLNIDTENYIAITYRGLCSAWHSSIADSKIGDAVTGISRGWEIAKIELDESKEYAKFCMEILEKMSKISNACMKMYENYYLDSYKNYNEWLEDETASLKRSGMYADTDWSRKRQQQQQAYFDKKKYTSLQGMNLTLAASNAVAKKITTVENISIYSVEDYKIIKEYVISYMNVPTKYLNKDLDEYKIGLGLMVLLDEKVEKLEQIERDNYFEEHPEEKKDLEEKINQSDEEKKQLYKDIKEMKEKLKEMEANISKDVKLLTTDIKNKNKIIEKLQEEKSNLGILKLKEKKVIQSKIDGLKEEIKKIGEKCFEDRKELRKEHFKEINDKIKKEKQEINKKNKILEEAHIKLYGSYSEQNEYEEDSEEDSEEDYFECELCGARFKEDLSKCPECESKID